MSALRVSLACVSFVIGLVGGARAAELAPGEQAPEFALPGSDGKLHRLEDYVGKQAVVLAWFPKAFTPGCTTELQTLRDHAAEIAKFEAAVFMVSLDTPEKNREFVESLDAKHVLLSDPTGEAAKAYGVTGASGRLANRWTFYIDSSGTIREVDRNVSTATAGQDIARKLGELGFPKR
jgi:peroxiredoxin Q/BCP